MAHTREERQALRLRYGIACLSVALEEDWKAGEAADRGDGRAIHRPPHVGALTDAEKANKARLFDHKANHDTSREENKRVADGTLVGHVLLE